MKRRTVLTGLAAGAGILAAPGILRAQDSGPVRIGLITTLSGPGQFYGNHIQTGAEIAVERINKAGGVAGRPLELVVRDDKGNPNTAVTVFRELSGSGIRLFAQGTFTALLLATTPLLKEANATMVMVGPQALALTHEAFTPNAFRLGFSSPMAYGAFGALMARRFPDIGRWAIMMSDVAALRDIARYFEVGLKREYAALGRSEPEVMNPVLATFGAADYRNQISTLMGSGAEGLLNVLQGTDSVSYYKQARTFGLDGKFKAVADSGNELSIAKAMGGNTPRSIWGWTGWYQDAAPNPVSREVLDAHIRRTGDGYPNWYVGVAHDSIAVLAAAVAATGSTDSAALIPTIEAGNTMGCTGTIAFRKDDHTFVGDVTFVRFGRETGDPKGWRVFETATLPGDRFVEPATPGKPFG
ncbi:ABC transporter substrate-binding protein [Azospirillum soli]|uniref:ABC transporter substrate-binding protein n=1 Tax=Azospirillum soli TaxID=1304799 RepID=UPI001AE71EB7|nr:ABC transporter substrate-binding protein [Azospirillum soli]MBP2316604.1 branched-chain amino acid transport system substrate-binding protein [Azospirillum soli]